jgi:myo-inositol-1(or 4)-monophosphatase
MEKQRMSFSAFKEEKILSGLSPALNVLISAARRAGRSVVRDFSELEALQSSGRRAFDFANKAAQKAENTLVKYLQTARPRYSYLLPDGKRIAGEDTSNCFIINALDGKDNFIRAIPFFSVSVALLRDNDILAGVVYNPVSDELFYAEKGCGAFLMSGNGDRRVRVSACNEIADSLIAVDFSSQSKDEVKDYQDRLSSVIEGSAGVRRLGCVSLAMAYTASGKFDGHWCRYADVTETAAGCIIVKEAGGHVSASDGNAKIPEMLYKRSIISANDGLDVLLTRALRDKTKKEKAAE